MDLKLLDAEPTAEERAAVDALLGPPTSGWDGGERDPVRDTHVAFGGHAARAQRHLLIPALRAVQSQVGWISEGALNYVCVRLNVPPADAWGVATFYALFSTTPRPKTVWHVCDDIACKCAGADKVVAVLERTMGPEHHAPAGDHVAVAPIAWVRSPCLGMCDQAPAALLQGGPGGDALLGRFVDRVADGLATPTQIERIDIEEAQRTAKVPFHLGSEGPLTARMASMPVTSAVDLSEYRRRNGYQALELALARGPEWVIGEVTTSKLLGRGGAAFPTGRKWDAVAKQTARPHYLVCNADESEPGTFKDRILMEWDPFALVESMTIAGFATGCEVGYLYIRGEYPRANEMVANAVDQAREDGLLGSNVMGKGLRFDIEIRQGAGAYICGEETALFNSIEGYRGEPRNKPPFPVQSGLFGKPTVVNNVETLLNVPHILTQGGAAYARTGTEQSTGTRLFCVSGCVDKPGLYELPHGVTARELLAMAGGVRGGRKLQTVLLGGAAGVFIRPDELDLKLTFEDTRAAKATLGSGVFMVFDDTIDLQDILKRIASFFRDESCGQCVPCRVGTVRQEEALHRIAAKTARGGLKGEIALLDEVGMAMKDASICGLGQTAYSAIESAIHRLGVYNGTAR
jgi:NADH-quinone oxidoreductase subunit F